MTETTIALITGANKGLGLTTARRLASAGWTVLLGSRNPGRGATAAAALASDGLAAEVVTLDVTSDDSVAAAAKWVEQHTAGWTCWSTTPALSAPGSARWIPAQMSCAPVTRRTCSARSG